MSVLDNFFEFRWEANRKQWSGPPVEPLAEYRRQRANIGYARRPPQREAADVAAG